MSKGPVSNRFKPVFDQSLHFQKMEKPETGVSPKPVKPRLQSSLNISPVQSSLSLFPVFETEPLNTICMPPTFLLFTSLCTLLHLFTLDSNSSEPYSSRGAASFPRTAIAVLHQTIVYLLHCTLFLPAHCYPYSVLIHSYCCVSSLYCP